MAKSRNDSCWKVALTSTYSTNLVLVVRFRDVVAPTEVSGIVPSVPVYSTVPLVSGGTLVQSLANAMAASASTVPNPYSWLNW